jgi:uncharacterized protein YcbX
MTATRRSRLRVAELWRYPVKSLRGEQLNAATVTTDGVHGDRLVHVRGPRGLLTGRTRPGCSLCWPKKWRRRRAPG